VSDVRTSEFMISSLIPDSPSCWECSERLISTIQGLYGVEDVSVDVTASALIVTYDEEILTEGLLVEAASRAGVEIVTGIEHQVYTVTGLDCPDCAATLDRSVSYLDGVISANLNFASAILVVEWDPERDPRSEVVRTIRAMGYGISTPEEIDGEGRGDLLTLDRHEWATAIAGILMLAGVLTARTGAAWAPIGSTILLGLAIIVGGTLMARRAFASLRARSLDMNVLMGVAVLGAVAIDEWAEAAMVLVLYSVGVILEARSLTRTRRSIRDLMGLAPRLATVLRHGEEREVPVETVRPGEIVVVRSGARVPLDGTVTRGESHIDESPVTGESIPVPKDVGDPVYSGTLNTSGLLEVEVTCAVEDSTLARVVRLVEQAHARKTPSQRLIDRFTRYYTPLVITLAVLVAAVPPVVGWITGSDVGPSQEWFYRGLVILVVSCPCALVISTPVAAVSAITRAARMGVLVKGGVFLERAPGIRVLAIDKTGTLTQGEPEVVRVESVDEPDERRILQVAAALEAGSTHPIARAVARAAGHAGGVVHLESFHDLAGRGVRAVIDGTGFAIGSPQAAHDAGIPFLVFGEVVERMEAEGLTALVLSSGASVLGVIGIADRIRPESARAVEDLSAEGIRHIVMLTGDNERTAEAVAELAGVREVRARLLPEEKVAFVEELRDRHGPVAMVGDGVNDAPALAAADIGVAMGVAGSDTALETADVALLTDDLSVLPGFFRLGRRTMAVIVQNLVLAITLKAVVLLLAAFGAATLWMAVFADTGVALLVILNGLRLLRE
jgi:Cd2+/Zn2+-exporting ATPase